MDADTSEKIRDVISFVHSKTLSIGVYSPGDISVANMYEEAASDLAEIIQQEIVKARIDELEEHGGQWKAWADEHSETVRVGSVINWYDARVTELKKQLEAEL